MDSHLERLRAAVAAAAQAMTEAGRTRHAEGKWSAAEILEHLYLTYTGTIKGFERCLEANQPLATPATLKQRVRAAVTVGVGYLPTGAEAPPQARPRGIAPEKVREEIGPKIAAMDEIITKCEAHYGRGVKLLNHPLLGPLTGKQWRKFHCVHGWHHLRQLDRLKPPLDRPNPP